MLSLGNVFPRLLSYPTTFLAWLLPAWAFGFVLITPDWLLDIDMRGLSIAAVGAVVTSLAIFQTWGIKPTALDDIGLMGSYLRVIGYSLSWLIGLLPANLVGLVVFDTASMHLIVDLKACLGALISAAGGTGGIFALFGLKQTGRP